MSNIVIMFSGGIDSTYMLIKYLNETNHTIHAHHVNIINNVEPRWQQEKEAAGSILEYLTKHPGVRPFTHSHSSIDLSKLAHTGWDSDHLVHAASRVCPTVFPQQECSIAIGWNHEDVNIPAVADRIQRQVLANLWKALIQTTPDPDLIAPEILYPNEGTTKRDMIRQLKGSELFGMTWSCRQILPTVTKPCGVCVQCIEIYEIKQELGI